MREVLVHECPTCHQVFDSPSICGDGTSTVARLAQVPETAREKAERARIVPPMQFEPVWRLGPFTITRDGKPHRGAPSRRQRLLARWRKR